MSVQRLPNLAVLGAIAPVCIQSRAGTLPFAHQEETATFAPAVLLRGVVKGKIPLKAFRRGLREVDSVLVGTAAVAALTVAFDSLNRARRVGIARIPDAGRAVVLTDQQIAHILEQIQFQRLKLFLQIQEAEKRFEVLCRAERVFVPDRLAFYFKNVQPRGLDANALEVLEPIVHDGKLLARGVIAMKCDNQARRDPFLAK